MSDSNALVKQAVAAYKTNDKAKAKDLLLKAVDMDDQNEQAWMWMSAVVDSLDEQQICLENALKLNPNNERAKKGLEVVLQKLGTSGKAPSAPSSGDIPTSVDWGKSDAPAAYGSGQNVPIPDSDQLDNWIDGLGIGGSASASSPNPSSPAPANDDPWASLSSPASSDDPWANLGTGSSDGSSVSSSDIDDLWSPPAASAPANEPPADPWATIDTGGGTKELNSSGNIWDEPAPAASAGSVNPFTTTDWDAAEVAEYDPFRSADPWEKNDKSASAAPSNDPFRAGADSSWSSPPPAGNRASADPFGGGASATGESWGTVPTESSSPSNYSKPATTPSYEDEAFDDGDFESGDFDFDDDEASASSYGSSSSYGTYSDFSFDDDDELFTGDNLIDIDGDFDDSGDDDASRYYAYIPDELRDVELPSGAGAGAWLMVVLLIALNAAAAVGLAIA